MDSQVKILVISNGITLLVLLAKILWDMTRTESHDLMLAVKENTSQIIKLAATMKYVSEELKKITPLSNAVTALERTVAIYSARLEGLDRDFREFKKEHRKPEGGRRQI